MAFRTVPRLGARRSVAQLRLEQEKAGNSEVDGNGNDHKSERESAQDRRPPRRQRGQNTHPHCCQRKDRHPGDSSPYVDGCHTDGSVMMRIRFIGR
jgi:hypothetical protein